MLRGVVFDFFWLNVFINSLNRGSNGRFEMFVVDINIEVLRNVIDDRISI